jgi:hypothetical protein
MAARLILAGGHLTFLFRNKTQNALLDAFRLNSEVED